MHILTDRAGDAASARSTRAVRLPHPPQCTKRIPGARATRHARSGHYHCPHLLGAAYPPRRSAHTPHGFGLLRAGHVADQCGIGPRTRRAVWPASRRTLSRSVQHRLARTSCGFVSIMQFCHRRAARTPPHGSAIRTCKRRVAEPFIRSTARPRIFVLRITRAARPRARPAALCSADC